MPHCGQYLRVLLLACVLLAFHDDSSYETTTFPGKAERALLLTAHPDDECMFFAPTILSLIRSSVPLYSLCLSVGDAEGLGHIRQAELSKSLQVLGIPGERSLVVNHQLLQDNFTQHWSREIVAEVVRPFIISHNITLIFTFDDGGVSQHPNHISIPDGVSHLLATHPAPPVRLFTLKTVYLLHKYIGPASNPITKFTLSFLWTSTETTTYVASLSSYLTALRAMYQHQSQLVWFRWLYVLFSRYMWINEWVEVQIHAASLNTQ